MGDEFKPICPELDAFRDFFTEKKIKQRTQKLWLELYEDPEWLRREILKAMIWTASNPEREKKNYSRYLSNWFSRASRFNSPPKPRNMGGGLE